MNQFTLKPIGTIDGDSGGGFAVKIDPQYLPALQALEGFSHIDVIWWFDGCDNDAGRSILEAPKPYRKAPAVMGTFATRSPQRPNPIALSVAQVLHIDHQAGIIEVAYLDASPGSPVLDIKPYTPSLDRVEAPSVPDWCDHWPRSVESSEEFDWENEFLF